MRLFFLLAASALAMWPGETPPKKENEEIDYEAFIHNQGKEAEKTDYDPKSIKFGRGGRLKGRVKRH